MTKYIQDLTANLIGTHNLVELQKRCVDAEQFFQFVMLAIRTNEIEEMTPETLGKIMCSLELGDVGATGAEIERLVHFSGNPALSFRELVAACLMLVIRDRLNGRCEPNFQPYPLKKQA